MVIQICSTIAIKTASECHDKTFRYGRMVHSVCSQTQDARSVSGQRGVTFLIITIVAINIRVLN